MSQVTGTVPVANLGHASQTLVLSTQRADQRDNTLSNVSWNLNNNLNSDTLYAPMISLKSFIFTNTTYNIDETNNTLKVLTVFWRTNQYVEDIITFRIPPGRYDIESLLSILNKDGNLNSYGAPNLNPISGVVPATGVTPNNLTYYGLGVFGWGANGTEPYRPFVRAENSPLKLQWQGPTGGKGFMGIPRVDENRYVAVGLIYDTETSLCLNTLGLLDFSTLGSEPSNVSAFPGTDKRGLVKTIIYSTSPNNNYGYTGQPIVSDAETFGIQVAPSNIDLTGPLACAVQWSQLGTGVLASYNGMNPGSIIDIVPLGTAAEKQFYQPSVKNPIPASQFDTSQITIQLRDAENGELLDFHNIEWVMTIQVDYHEIYNENVTESGKIFDVNTTTKQSLFTHPVLLGNEMRRQRNNDVSWNGGKKRRSDTIRFENED